MLIKVVVFALVQGLVFWSLRVLQTCSPRTRWDLSASSLLGLLAFAGFLLSSRICQPAARCHRDHQEACWHPVLENMPLLMRINTKSSSAFHSWLWQLGVCLGIDSFVLWNGIHFGVCVKFWFCIDSYILCIQMKLNSTYIDPPPMKIINSRIRGFYGWMSKALEC